tara:strand:+ start:902 stop:1486 length:585 start_codon:yes stop_codon:yes gene_type:complete
MLKLLPQQVSDNWDEIKQAILLANPAQSYMTAERLNNVLKSILLEESQCWALCDDLNPEDPKIHGICVTQIMMDNLADVRNLTIYALYSKKLLTGKMYLSLFLTLSKFAKANSCHRVMAYTEVPKIIDIVGKLPNGHSNYTFLSWDVFREVKPKELRKIIQNIDNELNHGNSQYDEVQFKDTLIKNGGYNREDI